MTTGNELTHLAKLYQSFTQQLWGAWQEVGGVGTQKSLDSFNECNQIGAEQRLTNCHRETPETNWH